MTWRCKISPVSLLTGRRGSRTTVGFFLVALASILLLFCFGCGKKGPPFLPESPVPPRVDNLQISWKNGIVTLEGSIKGGDLNEDHIIGCRVFSVWYSIDNPPCETCPVEMNSFQEIQGKVIDGTRFRCEMEKGKRTGITYFQVRLIGKGGRDGLPSNRVKVVLYEDERPTSNIQHRTSNPAGGK